MLFYITYLADEQRQRVSAQAVYAETEDEAGKIFHEESGKWAMDIEKCPNSHDEYLKRGLPLGEHVLGNHPYSDGVNHIQA